MSATYWPIPIKYRASLIIQWKDKLHYQVADDDLRAGLDGEVKGRLLGRVLHAGVDVGLDADEEQHTLDVRALHRHVEEVTPFVVHLEERTGNGWSLGLVCFNKWVVGPIE